LVVEVESSNATSQNSHKTNWIVRHCSQWTKKPKLKEESPEVSLIGGLEAALNFKDRLKALGFGDDGALWHSRQVD
jgi:hypothetical protein